MPSCFSSPDRAVGYQLFKPTAACFRRLRPLSLRLRQILGRWLSDFQQLGVMLPDLQRPVPWHLQRPSSGRILCDVTSSLRRPCFHWICSQRQSWGAYSGRSAAVCQLPAVVHHLPAAVDLRVYRSALVSYRGLRPEPRRINGRQAGLTPGPMPRRAPTGAPPAAGSPRYDLRPACPARQAEAAVPPSRVAFAVTARTCSTLSRGCPAFAARNARPSLLSRQLPGARNSSEQF